MVRKQSCPWYLHVIEGPKRFPMLLSGTARTGDTFFSVLYCEGFGWYSYTYHGGMHQHAQAHSCGPLYDGVIAVEPRAKGAVSQPG